MTLDDLKAVVTARFPDCDTETIKGTPAGLAFKVGGRVLLVERKKVKDSETIEELTEHVGRLKFQ